MASSRTTTRPRTAIVVGAGLSGLACARELEHLGWKVTVLESRDRVGGRVWTDTFLNGAPVDVGASFIHGINDNPIAELCLRRGVDLHERLTCPLFDADGSPLDPQTDKAVEDEFNATLERAAKRKSSRGVDKDESLESALQASISDHRKFSAREQRAFNWHLSNLEYSVNSDLDDVKNDGWDADDPFGLDGAHCVVDGKKGMGIVAEELANGLGEGALQLNSEVKRIIYYARGVKVEVKSSRSMNDVVADENGLDGSAVSHNENHSGDVRAALRRRNQRRESTKMPVPEELSTYTADVCIVTVSLGVLKEKSMAFCPDLPKEKKAAVENLGFGLLDKIALLFPYKFWSDDCEIFGWCSEKRGDMPIFVDLSQDGYPILCILMSGSPAEALEESAQASEDDGYPDIVKRASDILKKIFRDIPPVLEAKVTSWRSDAFSHGSYSFVACGSSPSDYDLLASPISSSRNGTPRVFFAGEATNRLFPASVHGAFFSGIREAHRLNKWFPAQKGRPPPIAGEDRIYRVRHPKHLTSMTEEVFKESFAPEFTFSTEQEAERGKVFLSKASEPGSSSNALTSPRAGGKRGRSRNPTGLAAAISLLKRPRLSLEALSAGDRVQISWKNGKYYDAWISTLTKNQQGQVVAGVYYNDGTFENVNLSEEKWRAC